MNDPEFANVPAWLADSDRVAPCVCGNDPDPHIPNVVTIDESTGLKRWWHYPCFQFCSSQGMVGDIDDEE